MIEKTVCITGHREIPPKQIKKISQRLTNVLIKLIKSGYLYFGVGGALGFDTMAAQTIIDLKKRFPNIKLILVIPCVTQAKGWSYEDKQVYEYIKEQADKIVYISEEYTSGCMYKRNRHLVNCSSICVCYLTKDIGGTAYTVRYAEKRGLTVINVGK